MSARTLIRTFAGPAAIIAALCLVDGGAVAYLIAREGQPWHTWRAVGDLDAVTALGVLGAVLYPAATIAACQLERLGAPRVRDHFRQCAPLYGIVAVFVAAVWPERLRQGGSLGFAVLAMLTAGAVLGIAANAGTLLVRRLVATRTMNVITAKW